MKKSFILLLIVSLIFTFAACGGGDDTGDNEGDGNGTSTEGAIDEEDPEQTDTETTASIVDEEAAFKSAISSQGTWIICTLKDLSFDEDLVLEGNFINGKKDDAGKDIVQRKIALYTQDEDRNVTNRFTLKAPKLTINSPMASIQHGTFVGDLYVSQDNFKLVDNKVEGNIYFTTDSAKSTFTMDETSSVTGTQEVKKP
ncbi:MAG TPA: hypothetical protein VEA58_09310 [Anaerovoracaceae bacterium]|nr:hypothetical protein [Anaerovoracaceae bacterium]